MPRLAAQSKGVWLQKGMHAGPMRTDQVLARRCDGCAEKVTGFRFLPTVPRNIAAKRSRHPLGLASIASWVVDYVASGTALTMTAVNFAMSACSALACFCLVPRNHPSC
jgi:hypothetical protein